MEDFMDEDTNLDGFSYEIDNPAVLTEISDQKDQGCCLAFALSDIVSMVMRISNKAPRAQPLIDSEALSVQKLLYVTTILGLESERTYPLVRVANEWNEELYRIRTHKLYKLNDLVYCDDPDLIKELIVAFDVLLYILVPEFEPNPVTSVTYCTTVYVALPPQTINPDYKGKDGFTLGPTLKKLKEANADGVLVKVLWGMVENDKRGEYQWSGYLELFEKLKKSDLKIQVAICFHEVSEGDFTVSLPSWILNVGEENPHIFFTDKQKLNSKECLSWGIDEERVLDGRTALEVYSDFMKSFRSTFKKFFKDKTITVIEVGLGPNGEPRYPSSCSKRGWKYPGVGAFQCYDNYMVENLKKNAFEDHYEFCDQIPKIESSYNSKPYLCDFFGKMGTLDSRESRYFLYWYAQQLIKHGDQVLSKARSVFGKRIVLNVKLSSIHWWFTHKGQSHAAELTAGFFNSRDHDGYAPFLRMLKANKAGLNVAVNRSYKSDPEQPNENPDEWLEEIKAGVVDAGRHPDFLDEDPVPLSSWNAVPCTDIASYREVLRQAEVEKQKTTYQAFTYHGLGPLMEAPEEFAEFVRIMHDAGDT